MSRIRVLVVDDSVVARMMVSDALASDSQIEVIGTAANGRLALTMVEQLVPDLVMMDLEMPVMDGIEAIRALRRRGDRLPIIVFSSISTQDAKATFNALAAGATDFVTKPSSMIGAAASLTRVAGQLIPKIKALVPQPSAGTEKSGSTGSQRPATGARPGTERPRAARPATTGTAVSPGRSAEVIRLAAPPARAWRPIRAVVIGASMGGPEALSFVLRNLARLPVPMLLVQHMPPIFTRQFAERLDRLCASTVLESAGGEELEPGHVYVAPGDHHLEVGSSAHGAHTVLQDGPPVNFSRPSVDTLFRSAVRVFGGDVLAVVLTGMGNDGRGGSEAVVAAGGTVLAQDEASSVVWGMPGAVVKAGLAHRVIPLEEIGSTIFSLAQPVRPLGLPGSEGAR